MEKDSSTGRKTWFEHFKEKHGTGSNQEDSNLLSAIPAWAGIKRGDNDEILRAQCVLCLEVYFEA